MKASSIKSTSGWVLGLSSILTVFSAISAAETPRSEFIQTYSNPHLGVVSFVFKSNGTCVLKTSAPDSDKIDVVHGRWKQVDTTNKVIIQWADKKYINAARIPKEGDVYYLILNGDSLESRNHCLIKTPTEYNPERLQNYDLMELSNGTPLCSVN